MVEAEIGDDAVQPGVEGAFKAEAAEIAVGLEKGFLIDILGVGFRGGQPQRQPQYRLIVLAHQFFEGHAVAALGLANQDVIVNAAQGLTDHVSPLGERV